MGNFTAEELAGWTGGEWIGNTPPPESVCGFCQDSRRIQPGEMFVALQTTERDGHAYVSMAAENRSSAALVERPVGVPLPQLVVPDSLAAFQAIARRHRQRFDGLVVGITGSAGKTSCKDLLTHLLGQGETLSTKGNFNNLIGVPLTLTSIDATYHKQAVIEAGMSEPGEMQQLGSMIQGDASIITTIAPAHLQKVTSLNAIAHEKILLALEAKLDTPVYFPSICLRYPDYLTLSKRARVIVPGNEFSASFVEREHGELSWLTYQTETTGDARLRLQMHAGGLSLFSGELHYMSPGMVSNAVLALWLARECGVDEETLRERLFHWQPSSMRGEVRRHGSNFYFVDCYNANPASMQDAYVAFNHLFTDRLPRALVLGSMAELGDEAEKFHFDTAAALKIQPDDRLILIGDFAEAMQAGFLKRGAKASQIEVFAEVESARDALKDFHGAVFLKGSRRWRLEALLPEDIRKPEKQEEGVHA